MAKRKLGTHFLKQWREYRGVSLRKLAGSMESEPGVELTSHANIGRIENMQQPYSQEIMEAVAEKLNCSVIDLLTVDPTVEGFSESGPDAKLRSSLIAFGVDGDVVEKEQKKAGVFGLKIGNSYSAMCQVNKAGLPKYDSPVLRTRYMTLSPEYDLTNKTISEYGDVLVALLAEVMGLAILDKELECRHVKFHLRSPADIPFFAAIGKGIKERDVFDAIETRGMWLYITRK